MSHEIRTRAGNRVWGLLLSDRGDEIEEADILAIEAEAAEPALDVERLGYAMSGCDGVNWPKRWEPEDFAWAARQVVAEYARLAAQDRSGEPPA